MRARKWMSILCVLGSTLLLTGCWDSMEINKRSIILEFAIDKNDDYTYDETKLLDQQGVYKYTYTIPDFGKLSGTQSLATDMETIMEIEAPTLSASVDDLQTRIKNTISFSHVKGVMLGETLMKDPELFEQTIDSLARNMIVARNTPVFAVNGKAELTAQIENSEQPILGLYIMEFFNNKERATNFFSKQLLGNFLNDMEESGISTLPIFHVDHLEVDSEGGGASGSEGDSEGGGASGSEGGSEGGGASGSEGGSEGGGASGGEGGSEGEGSSEGRGGADQGSEGNPMSQGEEAKLPPEEADKAGDTTIIEISGGAVIKDYELVEYLTKEEVRSQLYIKGQVRNAPVLVSYNNAPLTYNIKEQKSKMKFQEVDNDLQCLIEIDVKGNVTEYLAQEETRLVDTKTTEEIEKIIAAQIVDQIQPGIEKAKAINVDFLGIGLACYRHENDLWQEYGEMWEHGVFENLPLAIAVNVDVQNTGIEE